MATELKVKLSKTPPIPPPAVDPFPIDQKAFEAALGSYKSKKSQSTTTPGMVLDYIYIIDGENINVALPQAATSSATKYQSGADNASFGNNTNSLIKGVLTTYIDGLMNGLTDSTIQNIKTQNQSVIQAISLQNSMVSMLLDASGSFIAGSQAQTSISQVITISIEQLSNGLQNSNLQQAISILQQAQAGGSQCIALSGPIIIMAFMKPDLMKMGNGIITICTAFNSILQAQSQSGLTNNILQQAKSMLDSVQ